MANKALLARDLSQIMRDKNAAKQLRLIDDLHRLFSKAQVEHWLAGGWGIDFVLGKITRHHGDIDFAIWKSDWSRVEYLLLERGFTRRQNGFPNETGRLMKGACEIEFYLLQKNTDRRIIIGGRWSDWPFTAGSFGKAAGALEGIHCPVMSLEGQLNSKEQWTNKKHGGPPRDKDIADIELLRARLSRN